MYCLSSLVFSPLHSSSFVLNYLSRGGKAVSHFYASCPQPFLTLSFFPCGFWFLSTAFFFLFPFPNFDIIYSKKNPVCFFFSSSCCFCPFPCLSPCAFFFLSFILPLFSHPCPLSSSASHRVSTCNLAFFFFPCGIEAHTRTHAHAHTRLLTGCIAPVQRSRAERERKERKTITQKRFHC